MSDIVESGQTPSSGVKQTQKKFQFNASAKPFVFNQTNNSYTPTTFTPSIILSDSTNNHNFPSSYNTDNNDIIDNTNYNDNDANNNNTTIDESYDQVDGYNNHDSNKNSLDNVSNNYISVDHKEGPYRYSISELLSMSTLPLSNLSIPIPADLIHAIIPKYLLNLYSNNIESNYMEMFYSADELLAQTQMNQVPMVEPDYFFPSNEIDAEGYVNPSLTQNNNFSDDTQLQNNDELTGEFNNLTDTAYTPLQISHIRSYSKSPELKSNKLAHRKNLLFEQDLRIHEKEDPFWNEVQQSGTVGSMNTDDIELASANLPSDNGSILSRLPFRNPLNYLLHLEAIQERNSQIGAGGTILGHLQMQNDESALLSTAKKKKKSKGKKKDKEPESSGPGSLSLVSATPNTKGNGRKGANERPKNGDSTPVNLNSKNSIQYPHSAPFKRSASSIASYSSVQKDEPLLLNESQILPLTAREDRWVPKHVKKQQEKDNSNLSPQSNKTSTDSAFQESKEELIENESSYDNELVENESDLVDEVENVEVNDDDKASEAAAALILSSVNKLTASTYDRLVEYISENIKCESLKTLRAITEVIFDKAVSEPQFSPLYARLCAGLDQILPHFQETPQDHLNYSSTSSSAVDKSLRVLLLEKCHYLLTCDAADEVKKIVSSTTLNEHDVSDRESAIRLKQKNNMVFIGELHKQHILSKPIMFLCLEMLLDDAVIPCNHDIECACVLLNTIGPILDSNISSKSFLMDQYFQRLQVIQSDPHSSSISSRIRFMVQDLVELRQRQWKKRSSNGKQSNNLSSVGDRVKNASNNLNISQDVRSSMGVGFPQLSRSISAPEPDTSSHSSDNESTSVNQNPSTSSSPFSASLNNASSPNVSDSNRNNSESHSPSPLLHHQQQSVDHDSKNESSSKVNDDCKESDQSEKIKITVTSTPSSSSVSFTAMSNQINSFVEELITSHDLQEALDCFKEISSTSYEDEESKLFMNLSPDFHCLNKEHLTGHVLLNKVAFSDKKSSELLNKLICRLIADGLLSLSSFSISLNEFVLNLEEILIDAPNALDSLSSSLQILFQLELFDQTLHPENVKQIYLALAPLTSNETKLKIPSPFTIPFPLALASMDSNSS